jgi:hypothetical protein
MRDPLGSMSASPPAETFQRRRLKITWTRKLVALVALGVVIFLLISGLLARFLQTENVERDADLALIQAETRGDVQAMLSQIAGCRRSPACVASVRANAADPRTRKPGAVKILELTSPTAYSLFGSSGQTRFAWSEIKRTLPVVQCIDVRRTGNFLSGITVELTGLSKPIENEGEC